MGGEKKSGPPPGGEAKERHRKNARDLDWSKPVPAGLKARPDMPTVKSKHKSYLEFVENTDKQEKKLEFQVTHSKEPPPGFEFVPIGNPELTKACKDISRDQEAMIFIVTTAQQWDNDLTQHVNRTGHHVRQSIVEQARAIISDSDDSAGSYQHGKPEPIPETQEEINEQADKAIRDLFPRIPNTDRQLIIEHAFKKGATMKGEPLVGLAQDITLSRRVQLAVLAHIRHTHTRYDNLLRETSYVNARKAVESLCLDILVKWRGDEETGRDQLDEILREVIVISDSEDEDEDDEGESGDDSDEDAVQELAALPVIRVVRKTPARSLPPVVGKARVQKQNRKNAPRTPGKSAGRSQKDWQAKKAQRGFKRYQAARLARWDEAKGRLQHDELPDADHPPPPPPHPLSHSAPMNRSASHGSQPSWQHQPNGTAARDFGVASPRSNATQFAPLEVHRLRDAPVMRTMANAMSPGPAPIPDSSIYSRRYFNPPTPPVPGPSHQRVRSNDFEMRYSPAPPPSVPNHGAHSRVLVRSEQVQDYLVPSIEPPSPAGERPPASIFVRTLRPPSSTGPHDESAGSTVSYLREQPQSPLRAFPRDDVPHRRPPQSGNQNDYFKAASPYDPNLSHVIPDRRRESPLVAYPRDLNEALPVRREIPDSSRPRAPASAVRRQYFDADGNILRGDASRPIVIEEWATPPRTVAAPPLAQPIYRDHAPPPPHPPPRNREFIEVHRPAEVHYRDGVPHRVASAEGSMTRGRVVYDSRGPNEFITISENARHPDEMRPVRLIAEPPRPVSSPQPTLVRRVEVMEDRGGWAEYAPLDRNQPPRVEYAPFQLHAHAVQRPSPGPPIPTTHHTPRPPNTVPVSEPYQPTPGNGHPRPPGQPQWRYEPTRYQ